MVCTQVGFFQDGAPAGTPSLVSRLVSPVDDLVRPPLRPELTDTHTSQRTCSFYFPQQYTKSGVVAPTVNTTNTKYQGWGVRVPRLFFGTGRSTCSLPHAGGTYLTLAPDDPWKESTAASDYYSYPNTTDHPVGLGNGALTPCAHKTGVS
jgi:hypothetical protein